MRTRPSLIAAVITCTLMLGLAHAEQKPIPTNPGQPSGAPPSTPTWTVPGAQPSNVTIKQKSNYGKDATNPGAREIGGCNPPYAWSSSLQRCVLPINSPMNPGNPATSQR